MAPPITRTSLLLGRLSRAGMRRGLFEGSRGWLYLGLAATALRIVRYVASESEVVETIELKKGETIQIRSVPPKR
jgi:hypothetical protein